MAWYLRKYVSIGPVRFNLSKSGIGTSLGVKGFRVGVRPNGKSYIHAGRYGLYYRQELSKGRHEVERRNPPQTINEIAKPFGTKEYITASSQELVPQTRKELIDKLNKSYKDTRVDYICGVIFVVLAFIGFQQNTLLGSIISIVGIITTILIAHWESKRRTIIINYDFEDDSSVHFKKIISSFNMLASNSRVWSLIDSRIIYGTHESKLNAGAANLVNRSVAKIGEGKPPWVETNIDVPVMITRGQSLYMMPDGILVYDNKGVGFVEYDDVQINTSTTRFIEEHPPCDAQIVDKTWLHPNKKGGPDRRFNDNREIPVCLYGELEIKSNSGMHFYFHTSKHDSPSSFALEFSNIKVHT